MSQFALNEDQIAVRDMARDFAAEKIAPHAVRWDEEKHFPVDWMREAATLGIGGVYVVMVRTGGDGPGGISTLVIEGDTPGLSFGANERKMGWNAQPTRAVIFENARVSVANRLGDEGIGFKIAMAGLDGGRINIAACSLGGAQCALDKSLAYMKERKAFGKRLDEFQALQFRLAALATELEAARAFGSRPAAALAREEADATQLCAMAKRFSTDVGVQAANQALQ